MILIIVITVLLRRFEHHGILWKNKVVLTVTGNYQKTKSDHCEGLSRRRVKGFTKSKN